MVNVFEAVSANKRKSNFIIAAFVAFVLFAAFLISKAFGGFYGFNATGFEFMGIGLVISGVMSFASYYYSDKMILAMSGARPADKQRDFHFYSVTENLCLATGLPMPRLFVIEDTALNAFATGRDPKHGVVCATTGILAKLNRTELEGVIAHELAHIANYDTRLMSVVTILIGLVTLLGDFLMRGLWFGGGSNDRENRSSNGLFLVLGIAFAILAPFIAQLMQLAISRRREFLADATSAKITRQPSGLISALKKLGADREPLEVANKATAHLYIINPFKGVHGGLDKFASLFNTHPPLKDRISALEKMS